MGSSGDKTNSSVPTRNIVSQLATNAAAGAIGVMYICQPCLIGGGCRRQMISGGPVRLETAAAALPGRNFSGDYGVEGTGLPTPAMPNRVAMAAAL